MRSIVRVGRKGKWSGWATGEAEAALSALASRVELIQALRAYPITSAARSVMYAQAKCSIAV